MNILVDAKSYVFYFNAFYRNHWQSVKYWTVTMMVSVSQTKMEQLSRSFNWLPNIFWIPTLKLQSRSGRFLKVSLHWIVLLDYIGYNTPEFNCCEKERETGFMYSHLINILYTIMLSVYSNNVLKESKRRSPRLHGKSCPAQC